MNRMRELRLALKLSMKETAERIGIPYTTYVNYEKGLREPNSEMLISIANFFNTSIDYLLCKTNTSYGEYASANVVPIPRMKKIPLIGTISCGEPILAEENVEGFLAMPEDIGADFCLRCKGDSMINARIYDGDIVYIRQQPQVEDGEIAAVMVGDDEATLKRVHLFPDHIVLEPENPQYRAKSFWDEDMSNVRILGKAVAFVSTVI